MERFLHTPRARAGARTRVHALNIAMLQKLQSACRLLTTIEYKHGNIYFKNVLNVLVYNNNLLIYIWVRNQTASTPR